MIRRCADSPIRLGWQKVGKRFGGLPFFYYFCMQITYYLDMKNMNRLRNSVSICLGPFVHTVEPLGTGYQPGRFGMLKSYGI